jgi:hypothetical protein
VETVMGGLVGCDAVITHAVAKILKFESGLRACGPISRRSRCRKPSAPTRRPSASRS